MYPSFPGSPTCKHSSAQFPPERAGGRVYEVRYSFELVPHFWKSAPAVSELVPLFIDGRLLTCLAIWVCHPRGTPTIV